MDFDNSRPIYLQLAEEWRRLIARGTWKPGTRMDSVRDLAQQYEVNPNTVQRALAELEREGLAYSNRTAGRFITEDEALVHRMRLDLAENLISRFAAEAQELNLQPEELLSRLTAVLKKGGSV